MTYLLDAGPVGILCHSNPARRAALQQWLQQQIGAGALIYLPEVADYEVRRKLLHLVHRKQATPASLTRLDDLTRLCDYLPVSTAMWREAARLWSDARVQGLPTTADVALDSDVLLAAQALAVGGTVLTMNPKHLARFVPVQIWPIP
jgi:predicted nucleic acid-binding protein